MFVVCSSVLSIASFFSGGLKDRKARFYAGRTGRLGSFVRFAVGVFAVGVLVSRGCEQPLQQRRGKKGAR